MSRLLWQHPIRAVVPNQIGAFAVSFCHYFTWKALIHLCVQLDNPVFFVEIETVWILCWITHYRMLDESHETSQIMKIVLSFTRDTNFLFAEILCWIRLKLKLFEFCVELPSNTIEYSMNRTKYFTSNENCFFVYTRHEFLLAGILCWIRLKHLTVLIQFSLFLNKFTNNFTFQMICFREKTLGENFTKLLPKYFCTCRELGNEWVCVKSFDSFALVQRAYASAAAHILWHFLVAH